MLKKLIQQMKKSGQYPPFFLFSSHPINIGNYKFMVEANFVLRELPKDTAYLMTRNNIPDYFLWTIYNDCNHGFKYRGQCEKCEQEEIKYRLERLKEDERIKKLIERKHNEGFKSIREMLIDDCKNSAVKHKK